MISYLKGTVLQINSDSATVMVNNVGYQVFLTNSDLAQLKNEQAVEIFCYHHITDRSQELYGFLTLEQKRFFKLLTDHVAGIGPKSALKILEKINLEAVRTAITEGNASRLENLGLTRKAAEKIMIGLKGKIADSDHALTFKPPSPQHQEALSALLNLGYKKQEAEAALRQIDTVDKNTEEIIKETLRQL